MTEMTLAATEWKNTDWAHDKTLCQSTGKPVELDIDIAHFTEKLASYNPEALVQMKKIIWEGTDDWDTCAEKAVSGELVLSDFTKALNQFKK
jgi:methylglutaconyl-CoA hydratase